MVVLLAGEKERCVRKVNMAKNSASLFASLMLFLGAAPNNLGRCFVGERYMDVASGSLGRNYLGSSVYLIESPTSRKEKL